MARLGDVCNIRGGYAFKSESFSDNGIPVIRIGNITENGLQIDDKVCFDEEFWNNNKNYRVNRNDILVAMSGATVGKSCVNKYDDKLLLNQRVASISAGDSVENEYVYYFISSPAFTNYVLEQSVGCAQPNISIKQLSDIDLRIPTLKEQSEIVKILVKTDELICVRKKQLSKLDELVKSRFVEMFGEITEIVPISHYVKALTAGKSLAGEEECANKVLKTGAATYDEFDASQVKNLPVDYTPSPEHLLKDGDIIISRMNTAELVGATAYVWKAPLNTYLPDRLWRAELQPNANAIFVWQMLIQPSTKEQIRREASGTSGSMKNISKSGLLGLQVKKVPIELQNQFSSFVKQTDKLKFEVKESLEKLETLKKALMQKYFG